MVKCLYRRMSPITVGDEVDPGLEYGILARVTVDTSPSRGNRVEPSGTGTVNVPMT